MESSPQKIGNAVGAAVLAPSSHNTQPWLFGVGDSRVRVLADRRRALPVNDPNDRELVISCGCAIMNLRVGAAREGLAADVRIATESQDGDLLAEVQLVETTDPDPSLLELFPCLRKRRTHREKFEARDVDPVSVEKLSRAAAAEGAEFHVIAERSTRRQVAQLVAEGDSLQWANPRWRRELAAWMHPRRKRDGLSVPALLRPMTRAVIRNFDMGKGTGAKDAQLATESPLLVAISTPSDDRRAWLSAGQALERVLLTACAEGLQASYLNQPIQVSPLRPRLRELLQASGYPQILLRLGYPTRRNQKATPRRSPEEVMFR